MRSFTSPAWGTAAYHQSHRNELGKPQARDKLSKSYFIVSVLKLIRLRAAGILVCLNRWSFEVWLNYWMIARCFFNNSCARTLLVRSLWGHFSIPGPILTTRMLPGSPCPWRKVDEAKNSGIALGSSSSACLHASHIASGEASKPQCATESSWTTPRVPEFWTPKRLSAWCAQGGPCLRQARTLRSRLPHSCSHPRGRISSRRWRSCSGDRLPTRCSPGSWSERRTCPCALSLLQREQ